MMNKRYIVEFKINDSFFIPVEFKAENNELALNQAQGAIQGEWISLVDIDGNSLRVKSDKIVAIFCHRQNEE